MKLLKYLSSECIATGVTLADKASLLQEVATLAKKCSACENVSADEILRGLEGRESLGSTGFGGGIAIPHCRLDSVDEFVVGLITVPGGVEFGSLDAKPVKLVAFVVGPESDSTEHIYLLSSISRAFEVPGAVEEMIGAPTPDALRESFLRHVHDELQGDDVGSHLFHVVVQNEDTFQDVVNVFGGIDGCDPMVLNGENAGVYLSKIPLFANLWSDDPKKFNRVIVARVNKRITNETIRRIERMTGPLGDRNDVMVMVQDVYFTAGGLDT